METPCMGAPIGQFELAIVRVSSYFSTGSLWVERSGSNVNSCCVPAQVARNKRWYVLL
jgi:hypothetical protein